VNPYIFGFHEPCPEDVLPPGKGWFLHMAEVGDNPEPHPGVDLRKWSEQGYGTICRLQYSWGGGGTFPMLDKLDVYVERVRTCVQNSRGCHIWIIGNEPNHPNEWPAGHKYTPEYSAEVYNRCRSAIHSLLGHEQDEVLLPPLAPWTDKAGIDWIEYFTRMIAGCVQIDALALHTYSRGSDPASITDPAKMGPPYEDYYFGWPALYDWLDAIPEGYRERPVYLTETNQNQAWSTVNTGWVRAMYREINRHNQSGGQTVRCALLYRWPHHDKWGIEGNDAIISDFQAALGYGFTWTDPEPHDPPEGDNMLHNPSFEAGWHPQDEKGILMLPDGWTAQYQEGNDPYKRPEIKPNEEFSTDGRFSIRAFPPAHSRAFYGICQEVEVEAGAWYKFSADVRIESNPPGRNAAFVGIQPWGAGIFERQMIWGEETQVTLEWERICVIAQAFGGKIRVVMGATNEWGTTNNTAWFDNAALEKWTCDGEVPPVDPPVDPPEPGECEVDYGRFRAIVRDEIENRSPVRWP